jgi:NAD(P)-dependent dehydrogenase (short-subunit alcohol dehydrogenase family)
MSSNGRLAGRTALVTGAGSGNGAAIARRLREDGAEVVLLDRSADGLSDVLGSWPEALSEGSRPVTADITDDPQIEAAIGELDALDILVNNAGIVDPGTFPELAVDGFRDVLEVNLLGAYRCTRQAYELLCRSEAGRVVNITSMEAHWLLSTGGHVQPHYNASKAGLDLLTRALAFEFASTGVTVNAVAPGVIETALTSDTLAKGDAARWIVDCIPLDRVGRPEDVAASVAFLVSDDAAYVTGISIPVDGGMTLGWFRPTAATAGVKAAAGAAA